MLNCFSDLKSIILYLFCMLGVSFQLHLHSLMGKYDVNARLDVFKLQHRVNLEIFEPLNSRSYSVFVRVRVVLKRTVVGD